MIHEPYRRYWEERKNVKHIIWDFNGTLLSDLQLSVDTDNYVFRMLGIPEITEETYKRNITMPIQDFYKKIGIDFSKHPYEVIGRLWLDEFNRKAVGAGLVPDALKTVQFFNEKGISQSVLSASYEPSLLHQCKELGISDYMVSITGQENEKAERKLEIGERHLRQLMIDKEEIVLIGDMATDAELAEHLDVNCILVSWGHNDLGRLEKTGKTIVYSFEELREIITYGKYGLTKHENIGD